MFFYIHICRARYVVTCVEASLSSVDSNVKMLISGCRSEPQWGWEGVIKL